ncbi:Hypothetical_protein [Hexamita inflata]|uniref:Hypothetical_protein n=1 Tax=Hexamita inflata TaxID=28002 RepID=A0ABP1H691_9EUKA
MTSHDDIVNIIVHLIYKKYKPKAAITAKELGLDNSNNRPDIVTELDSQHFDVTIAIDTQKAYIAEIVQGYCLQCHKNGSREIKMYEEEVKNYLELQHLNIQSKLKVQPVFRKAKPQTTKISKSHLT